MKEKENKETKDFFEAVIESSRDGIVITDGKGYIFYINSVMERMCGTSKEIIIGKHSSELLIDERQISSN